MWARKLWSWVTLHCETHRQVSFQQRNVQRLCRLQFLIYARCCYLEQYTTELTFFICWNIPDWRNNLSCNILQRNYQRIWRKRSSMQAPGSAPPLSHCWFRQYMLACLISDALWWPPVVMVRPLYFTLWFLSFFFFPSPKLSGRRLDVYHASTHDVTLVRI